MMDRNAMEGPPNANPPPWDPEPEAHPKRVRYEVWREAHPCPDGIGDCPRCHLGYATYLAREEILNADA